jgi:hypothetical protein
MKMLYQRAIAKSRRMDRACSPAASAGGPQANLLLFHEIIVRYLICRKGDYESWAAAGYAPAVLSQLEKF